MKYYGRQSEAIFLQSTGWTIGVGDRPLNEPQVSHLGLWVKWQLYSWRNFERAKLLATTSATLDHVYALSFQTGLSGRSLRQAIEKCYGL